MYKQYGEYEDLDSILEIMKQERKSSYNRLNCLVSGDIRCIQCASWNYTRQTLDCQFFTNKQLVSGKSTVKAKVKMAKKRKRTGSR